MRLPLRTLLSSVLFVLGSSGVGGCAEPASAAPATPATSHANGDSAATVSAVRTATTRSPGQTEVVSVPGGGQLKRVELGEGFQHVAVGRLEADGTVSVKCVDSAPQAEAFLSGSGRADVQ